MIADTNIEIKDLQRSLQKLRDQNQKDQFNAETKLNETIRIENLNRKQLEDTIQELKNQLNKKLIEIDTLKSSHELECDHLKRHQKETIKKLRSKLDQKSVTFLKQIKNIDKKIVPNTGELIDERTKSAIYRITFKVNQ